MTKTSIPQENKTIKKTRKTVKPQGTLSSDDVVQLWLAAWEIRDGIKEGNMKKIEAAAQRLRDAIPDTTTNTGAYTRARNIRRKQDEEQAAQQAKQAESKALINWFGGLSAEDRMKALGKMEQIVGEWQAQNEIVELQALWGDER